MDTDNITLFEKDILAAQKLCVAIADRDKRNRAVANVIGAKLAASFFDVSVYSVDTESGLHNVAPILENYEISDIYINNSYIDVRVYFSDEEICVPKVHFDTGILPVAYMFIKLSRDLTSASLQGFIHPERIDRTKIAGDVYFLTPYDFESFYDIESRLQTQPDFTDIDEERILSLLDGKLSGADVISVLGGLVKSRSARQKLIQYVKAQSVFNFVSVPMEQTSSAETIASGNEIQESDIPAAPAEYTEADLTDEDLGSLFDNEENEGGAENIEYTTSVTPSGADVIESLDNEENYQEDNNSEQLESLFTGEQQGLPAGKPKKRSGGFMAFLVLVLLAAGGFYFYQNYAGTKIAGDNIGEIQQADLSEDSDTVQGENNAVPEQTQEAMPVETVDNSSSQTADESVSGTSVPAIERSLDASVLVSNLKIDWEVPEGYASNTTVQRYFMKIGKIIQLNLKTELLLLQKPPLSNKITVELKYNPAMRKFETVRIKDSSGEKTVDDLILDTVNGVLQMSVSTNLDSVSKLQGTPLLIIHL